MSVERSSDWHSDDRHSTGAVRRHFCIPGSYNLDLDHSFWEREPVTLASLKDSLAEKLVSNPELNVSNPATTAGASPASTIPVKASPAVSSSSLGGLRDDGDEELFFDTQKIQVPTIGVSRSHL